MIRQIPLWRAWCDAAGPCLVLLLVACPLFAWAAPGDCHGQFGPGGAPRLLRASLARETQDLCFQGFAVLHSGVSRTPLYSAEHLTPARIEAAAALPRRGEFHAEPALPGAERAELADYAHSGFDRGHMAPSGDMADQPSQGESFTLANMVPQAHRLNTGEWSRLESGVRRYVARAGDVYVVTGPAFAAADLESVGRVLVPTHVWKAVYSPALRQAGAFLAENTDDAVPRPVSLAQLTALTGVDPFPALRGPLRTQILRLRLPSLREMR